MSINDLNLYNSTIPDLIEQTHILLSSESDDRGTHFNQYSSAYLRTTENINGYYNLMDFNGKSVLTVIGSSDHIFDAILRGSKRVDGFDISLYAIMLYYLKEAAIKSLDYDEFINFFYVEKECFTRDSYKKIKVHLDNDVIKFWDIFFEQNNTEPYRLISKILFNGANTSTADYVSNGYSAFASYLSRDNYYKLKQKINNCEINIFHCDVKELGKIDGFYDYIILSNIFEYQKGQDLEMFKAAIEKYRSKLKPNGYIIVGYAYHYIDLSDYVEYSKIEIPSRFVVDGIYGAPNDKIIIAGGKKR